MMPKIQPPEEKRLKVPDIKIQDNIDAISVPENLHVGLMIAEQRKKCSAIGCSVEYYNFAFGQSPFPVPQPIQRSLGEHAQYGHYSDAEGILELREAISGFYKRHFNLKADPSGIVVGHGTKGLMYTIFSMIKGSIIIPSPSWIGYAPQLRLLNKPYHVFFTHPEHDYKIRPDELRALLSNLPDEQHLLILNNPHNPTGIVYTKPELQDLAGVCREFNTLVLADEIYALITYQFERFTSMGTIYPEGTFVTGGLSKDRSSGGYRLGTCILPEYCSERLKMNFQKIAATVYTNVSTPIQYAAITAYQQNEYIETYFRTIRAIHRIMGTYISRLFNSIDGITATRPEGGFYFLADFNDLAENLKSKGISDANGLSRSLISHPHHIATISGDTILARPDDYSARIAFVDYNGKKAFEQYQLNPPKTAADEEAFVRENAPRMISAVIALLMYVEKIKK